MVTLTIAICTFNRSSLVRRTITRILNQITEHNLSEKVELIVTNNGSSDNTHNELLEFSSKILVLKNQDNLPVFINAHSMAEVANGEYFWFFGDDDVIPDKLLLDLVNLFDATNDIVSLTMGRRDFKDFSTLDLSQQHYQLKRLTKTAATLNFREFDRLYGFISGNIHKKYLYLDVLNEFSEHRKNNYINKYICWYSTYRENMYFLAGSIIFKCTLDGAGSHFQAHEKLRVQTFILDTSEIATLLSGLSRTLGYLSFHKYLFRPKYFWRLVKQKYDVTRLLEDLKDIGAPRIYIFLLKTIKLLWRFRCKSC